MNNKDTTSEGQRTYTQEFRDEAVRLTVTSGKTVAQIARELGIASHCTSGDVYDLCETPRARRSGGGAASA